MQMKTRFFLLFFLAALAPGCATKWSLAVEPAAEPIQWQDDKYYDRAVYVGTIREFRETGKTVSSVLRSIVYGNSENDNRIIRPVAIAVGADNRIAIADPGCASVHLYIPSEQKYRKIFRAGKEDLKTPVSVIFDDESRLYVSDSSQAAIYVFDRDGVFSFSIKEAGNAALRRPTGITYFAGNKVLYAVDTLAGKVYAYNKAGALLFSFGAPGEQRAQLNFPTHIFVAPNGRLYLTDAMNFRVQVFDASGNFISSFGHHGNGSGDFTMPKGIVVDRAGVIYVVDSLFDNIQLFDLSGRFLFTIGRRGTEPGQFWLPSGLFLDHADKLYVCDTYNQRVQIIQLMRSQHE